MKIVTLTASCSDCRATSMTSGDRELEYIPCLICGKDAIVRTCKFSAPAKPSSLVELGYVVAPRSLKLCETCMIPLEFDGDTGNEMCPNCYGRRWVEGLKFITCPKCKREDAALITSGNYDEYEYISCLECDSVPHTSNPEDLFEE